MYRAARATALVYSPIGTSLIIQWRFILELSDVHNLRTFLDLEILLTLLLCS